MADPMVVETTSHLHDNTAKKPVKRKRASPVELLTTGERQARVNTLRKELEGLFNYYKEILDEKLNFDSMQCGSSNSAIACLLEESNLSLSKLVDQIYEKMKAREGDYDPGNAITVASVKSSVLFIGQRSLYGVPNSDADVLEDETESCLWCWETRDLKLMPKAVRGKLKNRRIFRKKIHDRIAAVIGMTTVLEKSGNYENYGHELTRASERLGKVLSEADIRLLVQSTEQKNAANMADKDIQTNPKQLMKQLERNKREAEKNKKRLERELKKEKQQNEKELKRLQDEAEKEERRREKEESELKKQVRRQQEEAEKDQRRKEKEEAEQKKQLLLQKQASLMERFLRRSKTNSTSQNDQSSSKTAISNLPCDNSEKIFESVTMSMDSVLSSKADMNLDDMRKSHLISWRHLGHAIRSNRKQHWGMRKKPKTEIIKELKLSTSRGLARDGEESMDKLDGWGETKLDVRSCNTDADCSASGSQGHCRSKQLLQFDKSYRPAFYGICNKKSQIIGSRHPFKKDPDLDYDIDSDEEWEEEEPGESLSDCDKDDEEERAEGCGKADDEDDSEDSFLVPDGYLSENEGVQVDRKESESFDLEAKSSHCHKQELESEEMYVWLRQQKCLYNLTEQALRKNQPLIILNLMHEKASLSSTEELTGTAKLEQMCLQALSIHLFPGGSSKEISIDNNLQEEDEVTCPSSSKDYTPMGATTAILDSDIPQIVSVLQSCSQGINKVVESLQQKFPSVPKTQLRNKVREISNFVDNRWQVKKDILDKLGLSISPEKVSGRSKSIAAFFSKRCLPPAGNGKAIKPSEASPQSSQKRPAPVQLPQIHPNDGQ